MNETSVPTTPGRAAREPEAEAEYLREASSLGGRDVVVVRALGQHGPDSSGSEVWLLKAACDRFRAGIPLHRQRFDPARVAVREDDLVPFGRCLVATGPADIRLGLPAAGAELYFLLHPWSGRVAVTAAGRTTVIDLWSAENHVLGVRPYTAPKEMFTLPAVRLRS